MTALDPFRSIAQRAPGPLGDLIDGGVTLAEGAGAYGSMLLDDYTHLGRTLSGRGVDAWDPDYIAAMLPIMRTAFKGYFRGEVRGLENIPESGPSLLVGNHSGGTIIADTFVFTMEFYKRFGPNRRFHQLAHDIAARMPGTGINRFGTVAASHENAQAAFEKEAPVLVYPGGDYETYRPSTASNEIQFGGRKGFVKLALEQGVPIVPVVAIGGQETALFVSRGEAAAKATGWAKLTRIKVLPVQIAPPFGISVLDLPPRIPLPAKITVEVLPPIDLAERFGQNPDHDEVYEGVTGDMQEALDELSDERSLPLVG
jgi:1-acyl-sn-glycerol-3-phosphate acyltransferase